MSDDKLTADIDREIRANDKIEQCKVSEVIQNAIEIAVALENNSPCKSLDSYKATLPGGIQSIFNEAMISGNDEINVHENCDSVSRDVYSAAEQVELVSFKQSVPDGVVIHDSCEGVSVTLEHADDITALKTAEFCNRVLLLEAVSDSVVGEGTNSIQEIVGIPVPSAADSDVPSEVVMHNVMTTATAGEDTDVPLKLVATELTDIPTVQNAVKATMTSAANADTVVQLDVPALGLTVNPATEGYSDILSDNDVEVLTSTPAAGPAAPILPSKGALDVTTVAVDKESIEITSLSMENAQTADSVEEADDNLPVKEADITDNANIVKADDVAKKVEVAIDARNDDFCDSVEATSVDVDASNAEIEFVVPTAVKHDTMFTTVDSELLIIVAPAVLSAEQVELAMESHIEVEAYDVSQVKDTSSLLSSSDICPADSNLPARTTIPFLSATNEADNSETLPETTAGICDMDKQGFDEVALPEACVPDTDRTETIPQEATLPLELLSTTEYSPADTAEQSRKVECSDSLAIESSKAAIISASSIESMEPLHLVLQNDIICPSIESVQCCAILLSVTKGEDCEYGTIHTRNNDEGVHNADQVIFADAVDQNTLKEENLTSFLQDQSSLCHCASETRDCESFQSDDLLKVDTFARRLDYLKSVDKLNSPKRIHDDDVLDGEAVNEIVVIKESVVVTENIFIQENVFIKESIVIKECITMETTKAMYRPASLVKSDKTVSPLSEKIQDNVILNDETTFLEPNPAIIGGPIAFQSLILIDDVATADFKEPGNEPEDGENEVLDNHVEEDVPEAGKCVKSKVSLFTRLFGKKEIPPVEKTFVPICCSVVLGGSTCYSTSAEDKVAVKCDKNADKPTVDMMTTEDSDEGFLDTA
jgi:hypothetical protein